MDGEPSPARLRAGALIPQQPEGEAPSAAPVLPDRVVILAADDPRTRQLTGTLMDAGVAVQLASPSEAATPVALAAKYRQWVTRSARWREVIGVFPALSAARR